jgi:hypothetical protein
LGSTRLDLQLCVKDIQFMKKRVMLTCATRVRLSYVQYLMHYLNCSPIKMLDICSSLVSILTALTLEEKNAKRETVKSVWAWSWRLGGKHGMDLGQVNHVDVATQGGTKLWRKQWNLHVWLDFGSYINTRIKEVDWEVEQKFDGMGEEVTSFHNPNYPIQRHVKFSISYIWR